MTTQTHETLESLAARLNIKSKARYLGVKINDDGWKHHAWSLTLSTPSHKIHTGYMAGMAHDTKAPKPADVLHSLIMDAQGVDDNGDDIRFGEWAVMMGCDPDSLKALAIYKKCLKIKPQVMALLGNNWEEALIMAREY